MSTIDGDVPALRWGVIGTGGIAGQFVADLELLPTASVTAVGSRAQDTADRFGDRFGIGRRYPDWQQLVTDDGVDAVYVATPHPMHHEAALLAIEAGKAVLVEKAFTVNAVQAQELVDRARARGVFLMEAMWTRHLPHIAAIRSMLADGRLGELCTLTADHGQWFADDPNHRLFNPMLGGGALLDLGVYPISFASMVMGTPERVMSMSDPAFTGVDGQVSILLGYSGGRQAVLNTSLRGRSPIRADIVGTEARIEIDSVWYAPSHFTVIDRDGGRERFEFPHTGHGLRHQAAEVARCVSDGRLESELMPLDETVSIMQLMDEIRSQGGYRLPGDSDSASMSASGPAS
ncbi:MAG: hypothetical protein QOH56_2404 [Pseudonocardiales bacterium]|jgi:predicted dehydrogenase|nr:hypothetical protein [Pseudonocardiales bacterium]